MTNASPFFEYISQITPISADAKTAILNVLEQKIYHKKEFLLSQKTVSNSIYFIKKGCIREF